MRLLGELGPFDSVLDVGGNVGEFAARARELWPSARVTSFEPLPGAAAVNRERADGRWWVEEVAVSSSSGRAVLRFCTNQHSASTMQHPGSTRRERFGIRDRFESVEVRTETLDELTRGAGVMTGRCLLKIDVEGHELEVLLGAGEVLELVHTVVVEVNQDPEIFLGSPAPAVVDDELRRHGLFFSGIAGVQLDPSAEVVQFDGVWSR